MNKKKLLILNGPGLAVDQKNGDAVLEQIREDCAALCDSLGIDADFRQTENQDEVCQWIANDIAGYGALIINPAGGAKADTIDPGKYESALKEIAHLKKPVIEVHLANVFQNGTKPLQGSAGEMGFICGMGKNSYLLAINAVANRL